MAVRRTPLRANVRGRARGASRTLVPPSADPPESSRSRRNGRRSRKGNGGEAATSSKGVAATMHGEPVASMGGRGGERTLTVARFGGALAAIRAGEGPTSGVQSASGLQPRGTPAPSGIAENISGPPGLAPGVDPAPRPVRRRGQLNVNGGRVFALREPESRVLSTVSPDSTRYGSKARSGRRIRRAADEDVTTVDSPRGTGVPKSSFARRERLVVGRQGMGARCVCRSPPRL